MADEFDRSAVYEAMDFSITAPDVRPLPVPSLSFENEDAGLLALSAGWQRQNPLSAWSHKKIAEWVHGASPDPTFTYDMDYRAYMDEDNYGYPPDQMVQARSKAESEFIRSQIDNEFAQMDLIGSSAWGLVGEFGILSLSLLFCDLFDTIEGSSNSL